MLCSKKIVMTLPNDRDIRSNLFSKGNCFWISDKEKLQRGNSSSLSTHQSREPSLVSSDKKSYIGCWPDFLISCLAIIPSKTSLESFKITGSHFNLNHPCMCAVPSFWNSIQHKYHYMSIPHDENQYSSKSQIL